MRQCVKSGVYDFTLYALYASPRGRTCPDFLDTPKDGIFTFSGTDFFFLARKIRSAPPGADSDGSLPTLCRRLFGGAGASSVKSSSVKSDLCGMCSFYCFATPRKFSFECCTSNQAVARNIDRFPQEFRFQLTEDEFENLKSQFVTSSWGGVRKLPYAFTEQGRGGTLP